MDLSKMTSTVQEAFADAQQTALRQDHSEIDIAHLWKALSEKNESLLNTIYEKLGLTRSELQLEINRLIGKKPKVTGDGVKGGQYLSKHLQQLLTTARKSKNRLSR